MPLPMGAPPPPGTPLLIPHLSPEGGVLGAIAEVLVPGTACTGLGGTPILAATCKAAKS